MRDKKKLFLGTGIFWLALLCAFIGFKEHTLRTGTEVLLKLRPVDPRDLFRGDYVILSYDISELDKADDHGFRENETVFTRLQLTGGIAEFAGASGTRPADGLFIAGKITAVNNNRATVIYGIESYFVPEGAGLEIERSRRDILAKIVIDSAGRGVVKALVEDGKELTFKKRNNHH